MENLPILFQSVELKCPKLRPVFLPSGVQEKQILKRVQDKKKLPKETTMCSVCSSEEGEMVLQVFCDYNLSKRKAIVKDVNYVCPLCKYALNVDKVMELLVNSSADNEEVDTLIRHFLLVNGHTPDDQTLMEEIVSSCYSLKVVFKSLLSPSLEYSL